MAKQEWVPRFAELGGITYPEPLTTPDWRRLRRADVRPIISYGYLSWPTRDGSTSSSPAHEFAFGERDTSTWTPQRWLQHAAEGLEMPGAPSDYHFHLQHVLEALWRLRVGNPAVYPMSEQIALLNHQLLQARPDIIRIDETSTRIPGPTEQVLTVRCYPHLIKLYEREGFFEEAMSMAQAWSTLGADVPARDTAISTLRERLDQQSRETRGVRGA